jgi:hypothetical protein
MTACSRKLGLFLAVVLTTACAPFAAAPPTPVPIRAVYLVTGPGVLAPSDVQGHPEILVVHSFDQLAAHTHGKVALWIDKSATPFDHSSWLNDAPQAYYPLVLVGYHDTLYSFKYMLSICCFLGPIVDWRMVRVEPGFCVIQREDLGGPIPQATFGQCYDQVPTAGDILAITDALLDGRLQTPPPTPETSLVGAPTRNPPFPAPSSAPGVVSTVTPFVPPTVTAFP